MVWRGEEKDAFTQIGNTHTQKHTLTYIHTIDNTPTYTHTHKNTHSHTYTYTQYICRGEREMMLSNEYKTHTHTRTHAYTHSF